MRFVVRLITPLLVLLLWTTAVLLVLVGAFTEPRVDTIQKDFGLYQALLSAPNTFTQATIQQAITDLGATKRHLSLTTGGTWAITANLTIPANLPLHIPHGSQVSIANGMTLTLAACPKIDQPLWLQPGTTGTVRITAPGCPIHVEQFATGGTGTQSTPWTGWDTALVWASGSTDNTQNSHSGSHYVFGCGNYTQTTKIILPYAYTYVMGDPSGGVGCVFVDYEPTGSADADGYYTAWEFGTVAANGGTFWGRFENLQLHSNDITKKKRGLHIIDMRHFTVRNVSIFGTNAACSQVNSTITGIGWCDTTTYGSVGIYVDGREYIHLEDIFVVATRPIYLEGTPPGKDPATNIDHNLDVTSFANVSFWQVPNVNPMLAHSAPIYFAPLVFVTNFDIAGTCSLIGGEHAIYFDQSTVDPNRTPATTNMAFANCRHEGFIQTGAGAVNNTYSYWFVGQSTSSTNPTILTHNLSFKNMVWMGGGAGRGWKIDRIGYVLFDSCNFRNANYGYHMDNLPNIGIHLGPNTYPVTFLNSWFVDSSFVELAGNQCVYFNSGANGRYGPFRGAPLVVVDANDTSVGCTQLPFTPTIPAYPATPASATSPPVNAGQPFTPILKGDTGGSTPNAYAEQIGYWTRSGKIITVFARVTLSTKGNWAGAVSLDFNNGAIATGNKPPPPPSALLKHTQGLTMNYANLTLPQTITCVEGTPNTCTLTAGSITQLSAVFAPHYNEPPGTEPANNPEPTGNVLFLAQGNGSISNDYLTWSLLTNTTVLEVSGSYMTEH